MKFKIVQRQEQQGFERVTVFDVVDETGAVVATCDSKADARLEIRNLDLILDEKIAQRRFSESLKEEIPQDEGDSPRVRGATKGTTWGDGRSTNNASDIDRERYRVVKGNDYNTWKANLTPADGFHESSESRFAAPDILSEDSSLSDWGQDPEALEEQQEMRQGLDEQIKEAEKSLSDKQFKVWELHAKLHKSFADTAFILKMSEGAAKTHYKRALANLKKYLEGLESNTNLD